MTDREAKRLALETIITSAKQDVDARLLSQITDGRALDHAERTAVRRAAVQILATMKRRADRLRSVRCG